MKTKIKLILVACIICTNIFAQDNKSNNFQVEYLVTNQLDSLDQYSINQEIMYLKIRDGFSEFVSKNSFLRDSLRKSMVNSSNSINLMRLFQDVPKTKFKEKIYKNFNKKQIILVEKIFRENYFYEQDMKPLDWDIEEEYKEISGYLCQKANLSYKGRYWTAWFTSEIPISDGPYKFHGLPGLIMEMFDSKGHYNYTLQKVYKKDDSYELPNLNNMIKVTPIKLNEIRENFYKNAISKLEQSGITLNIGNEELREMQKKGKKERNNSIELVYEYN